MGCEITESIVLVQGVDYILDLENGRIMFLSGGQIPALIADEQFCGFKLNICCGEETCVDADVYGCDMACYVHNGYDTVFQQGAEAYRTDDEKMVKKVTVEAEPLPQSTPADLECEVGYGAQPSCYTWKPTRALPFECQTARTPAQHTVARTRPDGTFNFPTWRRGRYISARFRVRGVGGGGTFSALHQVVKGWGQPDSP